MKCINCNKEFEAKRSDAKFCSTICRVRHTRKLARGDGNKIENKPSSPKTMLQEMTEVEKERQAWVVEIEAFCNENNCTHKDLVNAYTVFKLGSVKSNKEQIEWAKGKIKDYEASKPEMSNWRQNYMKQKLGIKPNSTNKILDNGK